MQISLKRLNIVNHLCVMSNHDCGIELLGLSIFVIINFFMPYFYCFLPCVIAVCIVLSNWNTPTYKQVKVQTFTAAKLKSNETVNTLKTPQITILTIISTSPCTLQEKY